MIPPGTSVTDGDSLYVYFHTVLGLNEYTSGQRVLEVYPNPVSGSGISITFPFLKGDARLEILNELGQTVYSEKL
jgi:hypothetical protein